MAAGSFVGDLLEFVGINNPYSSAGKERLEAEKARNFEAEQAELDRQFQMTSAQKAMDFEAEQAELTRLWQENMSNTAYQRSMADLEKAGLNPILAAGSPASTPSGATASGFSASGSKANSAKAQMSNLSTNIDRLIDSVMSLVSIATTGQTSSKK